MRHWRNSKIHMLIKNACTSNALGWEFENEDYIDIKLKLESVNKFTIEVLKNKLPADDFMIYCKDRLGIYKTMENVLE